LHDRRRDACPTRAEEREAGLVGEQERERQQHGRGVQHDRGRTDACKPRHDRDRRVPERERVPRMQPAVAELVDRPQRERVEAEQLLLPGQVEERVAVVARDPPERDPGDRAKREHARGPGLDRRRGQPRGAATTHDHEQAIASQRTSAPRTSPPSRRRRAHAPRERRRETAEPSAAATSAPAGATCDRGRKAKAEPEPCAGRSREKASSAGARAMRVAASAGRGAA
jgi:hypothetical protein